VQNLEYVSKAQSESDNVIERMAMYEQNLAALAAELNEIRRDERRMAELYDLVFEYVRGSARADADSPSSPTVEKSGSDAADRRA